MESSSSSSRPERRKPVSGAGGPDPLQGNPKTRAKKGAGGRSQVRGVERAQEQRDVSHPGRRSVAVGGGARPRVAESLVPPGLSEEDRKIFITANLYKKARLEEETRKSQAARADLQRATSENNPDAMEEATARIYEARDIIVRWSGMRGYDLIEFWRGELERSASASTSHDTREPMDDEDDDLTADAGASRDDEDVEADADNESRYARSAGERRGSARSEDRRGGESAFGNSESVLDTSLRGRVNRTERLLTPSSTRVDEKEVSALARKLGSERAGKPLFMKMLMSISTPVSAGILATGFAACFFNPVLGCSLMITGLACILITTAVKTYAGQPFDFHAASSDIFLGLSGGAIGIFLGGALGIIATTAFVINPLLASFVFGVLIIGGAALGGAGIPFAIGRLNKSVDMEAVEDQMRPEAERLLVAEKELGVAPMTNRRIEEEDDGTCNYFAGYAAASNRPDIMINIQSLHLDFLQSAIEQYAKAKGVDWPKPEGDPDRRRLMAPDLYVRLLDFLVSNPAQYERIQQWGRLDPDSAEGRRLRAEIDYYFAKYLDSLEEVNTLNPMNSKEVDAVLPQGSLLYQQLVKRQELSYWQPIEPSRGMDESRQSVAGTAATRRRRRRRNRKGGGTAEAVE